MAKKFAGFKPDTIAKRFYHPWATMDLQIKSR